MDQQQATAEAAKEASVDDVEEEGEGEEEADGEAPPS